MPATEPTTVVTSPTDPTSITGVRRTWNRHACGWLVFAAGLLFAVFLRLSAIDAKTTVSHDGAISYLAATGHLSEYHRIVGDRIPPYGQWSRAAEWKRLIRPEKPFCFGQIARDLGERDKHPPLYFWLLHIWCLIFGVHMWTGPSLNLVIVVLAAFALFGLARHVLRDTLLAGFVTLLWSVNPNVVLTGVEARHYDLVALFSILFMWQTIRLIRLAQGISIGRMAVLALITAGGMLTHYLFLLVVGGGLVLVLYRVRRSRSVSLRLFMAIIAGFAVFALLNPTFHHSLRRAAESQQTVRKKQLGPPRHARVWTRYSAFLIDSNVAPGKLRKYCEYATVAALAAMLLAPLLTRKARRRQGQGTAKLPDVWPVVFFAVWLAATSIALYLARVTPRWSMEAKYSAMVWPAIAFAPALLAVAFRRVGHVVLIVCCIAVTYGGFRHVRRSNQHQVQFVSPEQVLASCSRMLLDNVTRGRLPRAVWFCPDSKIIFAAKQAYIYEHESDWLPDIEAGTLYVSPRGRGSSRQARNEIVFALGARYHVQVVGDFWDLGPALMATSRR